jgi:hypothetical protein
MPRAYELHLVSTPLQEGQTKIAVPNALQVLGSSGCCMVSPQEGHTRTGVSSGTSGGHSMAGIEGM